MDQQPAFGFKELFHHVVGDMAKAISERAGESNTQQFARSQAAVHMIMGFLPRDVIEAMLAGHCVMFHELMIDTGHHTLCGEPNAQKRATRGNIVAMNKAFHDNLTLLDEYQARPSAGSREDAETGTRPSHTARTPVVPAPNASAAAAPNAPVGPAPNASAAAAPNARVVAAPNASATTAPNASAAAAPNARVVAAPNASVAAAPSASVAAIPGAVAAAIPGAVVAAIPNPNPAAPDAFAPNAFAPNAFAAGTLVDGTGGVHRTSAGVIAACRANPAAMAALEAGDPEAFAHAMGIEKPSDEFLTAANAPDSPFLPKNTRPPSRGRH